MIDWLSSEHTTIDIDDPILKEIKAIQIREGRSMGKIVSQLLAEAFSPIRYYLKRLWKMLRVF